MDEHGKHHEPSRDVAPGRRAVPTTSSAAHRPARYVCPMHADVRSDAPGSCLKCGMTLELVAPPAASTGEWTCPMHPEIVRDGPGTCPKCGMALEPKTARADEDGASHELRDMRRRFWFAGSASVPLLLLAMDDMLPGRPVSQVLSMRARTILELVLATPVCSWAAWPFFVRAVQSVRNRSLNMFTLIGLGVFVAYSYSLVAGFAPGIFPASFRGEGGGVAVYFEAAAVIVTLILLGQVLELRARSATGAAIKKLLGLAPKTARRLADDGSEEDVPLDAVVAGDRLRVRPGEKVPVDGVVLEGYSSVDEVDGHGRADPGREARGRPGRGGHRERHRRARDARGEGRSGDAARADRRHGGRGPAEPRADPEARGRGVRLLRADGHRGRGPDVRRLERSSGRSRGWPTRSSTPSPC